MKEHTNLNDLPPVFWVKEEFGNRYYMPQYIQDWSSDADGVCFALKLASDFELTDLQLTELQFMWSADRKTWHRFK